MKDISEASYLIGIKIHRDRSPHMLGFRTKSCLLRVAPIAKGDRFNLN